MKENKRRFITAKFNKKHFSPISKIHRKIGLCFYSVDESFFFFGSHSSTVHDGVDTAEAAGAADALDAAARLADDDGVVVFVVVFVVDNVVFVVVPVDIVGDLEGAVAKA